MGLAPRRSRKRNEVTAFSARTTYAHAVLEHERACWALNGQLSGPSRRCPPTSKLLRHSSEPRLLGRQLAPTTTVLRLALRWSICSTDLTTLPMDHHAGRQPRASEVASAAQARRKNEAAWPNSTPRRRGTRQYQDETLDELTVQPPGSTKERKGVLFVGRSWKSEDRKDLDCRFAVCATPAGLQAPEGQKGGW